jgi:hypothetical protein
VAQAVVRYRDPGFDYYDLMIATAGRPLGAFSLATFEKKRRAHRRCNATERLNVLSVRNEATLYFLRRLNRPR